MDVIGWNSLKKASTKKLRPNTIYIEITYLPYENLLWLEFLKTSLIWFLEHSYKLICLNSKAKYINELKHSKLSNIV